MSPAVYNRAPDAKVTGATTGRNRAVEVGARADPGEVRELDGLAIATLALAIGAGQGYSSPIADDTRTLLRGSELAIPTVTLRRVIDELKAHGGVRRGYLGVGAYPATLPPGLAAIAGRDRGALIANLEDGGPAASAGLIVGDILVQLDGVAITGPDALRHALGDRPGATVKVVLIRGGARQEQDVAIGSRP